VVFAMLASYLLSRTLVPTMVKYLLRSEVYIYQRGEEEIGVGPIWRVHYAFHRRFLRMRESYKTALAWCLAQRRAVVLMFAVFVVGSFTLIFWIGEDFFPYTDSGQMRLHVRVPEGTRIEETERLFAQIEDQVRQEIPADEMDTILDNIGLPISGINLAFSDSVTLGPADGEILISLKPDHRTPTQVYTRRLRDGLRSKFPDARFFFQAANITNQILNFGLPAPIDVQVVGRDAPASYKIAKEIERRVALIPGAVDVHVHQEVNYPTVRVDVDRTKAEEVGLTQQNVANSVLISLSSSGQVAPNQWLNPENGVNYQLVAQTPQNQVDSFDALLRTPITLGAGSGGKTQLLSNLASVSRGVSTTVASHYNVQPVMDVYANVEQRDLGGVAHQVERIMSDVSPQLPKGSWMALRGQVQTMRSSFVGLGFGILFAIVLVYLLMAVNFQSWVDPFIILWALPGALAGIVWMLFVTQTTFSVPSLMGTIMCIGVATSNSILLVTFANDERLEGKDSRAAALSAGFTRIRPVIMTALAMIVGMLPMALGLGEGGEQNAPLGRAVIGGLLVATFTTLFFVPVMYSYLRKAPPLDLDAEIAREEHEEGISLH